MSGNNYNGLNEFMGQYDYQDDWDKKTRASLKDQQQKQERLIEIDKRQHALLVETKRLIEDEEQMTNYEIACVIYNHHMVEFDGLQDERVILERQGYSIPEDMGQADTEPCQDGHE